VTRIAVVGVGAIGGAVAADLSDLGRHELTLCVRTGFDRLIVEHPGGKSEVDAAVVTEPDQVGRVDWVLLATKAHQAASASRWLDALCGPSTKLAVLQNGVDHEARVRPWLDASVVVVPVVVQLPAEKTAPGRVRQGHDGLLIVPDDHSGSAFADLFEQGRTTVKPSADFVTQQWWKLVSNASIGGVCALAMRENGVVADPQVRPFVLSLMREVVRVGRAAGANLPDDAPEKALAVIENAAPDHWSSITVDRREGRPMEWQARNEVVGRIGRKHGIATPLNDAITAMLKVADEPR
jgi:2-dehydropantoate 2-reductase